MSAYDDASARLSQAPATPYYNLAANSVTNPGGLGGYGHRTAFFALIADILTVASYMLAQATAFLTSVTAQATAANTSATNAAASATTAVNAPGTSSTSVTPNDITGAVGTTKTWVIQTGKSIVAGMPFRAARTSAATTQYMDGTVQSYNTVSGQIQIAIEGITGAGLAITDWTLSLTGPKGGIPTTRNIAAAGLAVGGGDMSADRTITVPAASAADVRTGADLTKAVTAGALTGSAAFITLTDAATIAWDTNQGYNATVIMAGSRIIGAPTGLKDGQTYTLEPVQDATGGRVPSWASIWNWGSAGVPILQTGANKRDKVFAQYNAATGKLDASFWKGA